MALKFKKSAVVPGVEARLQGTPFVLVVDKVYDAEDKVLPNQWVGLLYASPEVDGLEQVLLKTEVVGSEEGAIKEITRLTKSLVKTMADALG